jgi:hypothetical protein
MFPIVDVSDTTMAASGTTKRISINNILACSPTATLASATITGNLTVRTNALTVDANNNVGIGTTAPTVYTNYRTLAIVGGSTGGVLDINPSGGVTAGGIQIASTATGTTISSIGPSAGAAAPFIINTGTYGATSERYRIAGDGVATWSNVGGVSSTAMTLNATGLGIGVVPSVAGENIYLRKDQAAYTSIIVQNNNALAAGTGCGFTLIDGGVNAGWFRRQRDGTGNTDIGYKDSLRFRGAITGTERTDMLLDASGNLLVGTTSNTGSARIYTEVNGNGHVVKQLSAGGYCFGANAFSNGGTYYLTYFEAGGTAVGSITSNGTGVTYGTLSDYRLKESVAPLNGGLARVNALKPSIYKWKSNGSDGEGFLAHELAEVVPSAVTGEKDAVNEDGSIKAQGVDLSKVVPILVAAIKELAAEVNALKKA